MLFTGCNSKPLVVYQTKTTLGQIKSVVIVIPKDRYDIYSSREYQNYFWNSMTDDMENFFKAHHIPYKIAENSDIEINGNPMYSAINELHPSHIIKISKDSMLVPRNELVLFYAPSAIFWLFRLEEVSYNGLKINYKPAFKIELKSRYCQNGLLSEERRKICAVDVSQTFLQSLNEWDFIADK
jgi:hypothetical protein